MIYPEDFINKIILGDNLDVMKNIPDKSIDLIYLDPPYGSNDTDKVFGLKWKDIEDYISWMRPRLQECHRILKSTGSIYLQCDWRASHYLKLVLDEVFGYNNFRNEIVWCYSGRENPKQKVFPRKHDVIFYYTKTNNYIFNLPFIPYRKEYIEQYFKYRDEKGLYRLQPTGKRRRYKQHLSETRGQPVNDLWTDIKPASFGGKQKEQVCYPTQKPKALLERIIETSSNKRDIVLDPFCGSGTTLAVAWTLNRNYIGIDNNEEAVRISRGRPQLRQLKL